MVSETVHGTLTLTPSHLVFEQQQQQGGGVDEGNTTNNNTGQVCVFYF